MLKIRQFFLLRFIIFSAKLLYLSIKIIQMCDIPGISINFSKVTVRVGNVRMIDVLTFKFRWFIYFTYNSINSSNISKCIFRLHLNKYQRLWNGHFHLKLYLLRRAHSTKIYFVPSKEFRSINSVEINKIHLSHPPKTVCPSSNSLIWKISAFRYYILQCTVRTSVQNTNNTKRHANNLLWELSTERNGR